MTAETENQQYDAERINVDDELNAAKWLLKIRKSRDNFIDFCEIMMPDPNDTENPDASRFKVKKHHLLMAQELEEVERGENLRLGVSMPPQHGKSEQISRLFPAWYMGRNPYRNLMFGTYSQDFANDFGDQVRTIMNSARYKQIFPECSLRKGSKAKDHMTTTRGGQMSFIGRGGAGTGKPADLFVIDDPIKDDAEAQSDAVRKAVYQWFTKVAYSRIHTHAAIAIVHTRWHEDDLIGRLLDEDNPEHDPEIARHWKYINIPAVVSHEGMADVLGLTCEAQTEPAIVEAFGDQPISALWPERFSLAHLASAKRLNPRGFQSLYMGKPTPDDGEYFKKADFIPYRSMAELPANLRKYAASDHGTDTKQQNDPSCLGCIGVDEKGDLWILPDIVWERMESDSTVEAIISQIKRHKPDLWFMEKEHISKTFGPFLRKRMREDKAYCSIVPVPPKQDLVGRARSIQGMSQMKMIHVPVFASWWSRAQNELLKFPNGAHDDFVSFLALIGIGLDSQTSASKSKPANDDRPTSGTMSWLKRESERKRRVDRRRAANAGW